MYAYYMPMDAKYQGFRDPCANHCQINGKICPAIQTTVKSHAMPYSPKFDTSKIHGASLTHM